MVYGIIILAVAVFIAYTLNKSKVSEVATKAPEKIEPIAEPIKEVKAKKAGKKAAKKTK
jgi:hypothetical protein